jgi:hypothetical protein
VELGAAGERAFHGVHVLPRGGDVERDVALAFELVALRHVAQQGPTLMPLQLLLEGDGVTVGVRGDLAETVPSYSLAECGAIATRPSFALSCALTSRP